MSLQSDSDIVVVDASVLVSISSMEASTYLAAETALDVYTESGSEFFAPNVIVAEVIFALCQKLAAGVLTDVEHKKAVESFLDLMKDVALPKDERRLISRAVEIRGTYGCSRSSDSLYLALAEDLAKSQTVELFTLDRGMINQAAKHAPMVTVRLLEPRTDNVL